MNKKQIQLSLITLLFLTSNIFAQEKTENQTKLKVGGYFKADFISSVYNNGEVIKSNALNSFHIPGLVPVGEIDKNSSSNFHVKESRINLNINSYVNNKAIRAFAEIDFMLSPSGNNIVSNSYSPRLRHFFIEYDYFLIGQTWSTFMIVTLPDDLDFMGAAEGVVFNRQPQLRYSTKNGWQFSLENPSTTYLNQEGKKVTGNYEFVPDAVVRKNFSGYWGSFSVSTIFRNLTFKENDTKQNHLGYGISTGGKLNIGEKDKLSFSLSGGKGIGRYLAVNFITGGVYGINNNPGNEFETNPVTFETIPVINGYFSYQHHWNDKWKSNVNYSALYSDNPDNIADSANKSAWSASGNILYSPAKKLMIGMEYMHAYRQIQSGDEGSMDRIQLSAKYSF